MIFSPKKKSFYTSHGLGPGNFTCSFEIWNLLSLSSRPLFGYENNCLSNKLAANFDPNLIKAAEQTLMQKLAGTRCSEYMRMESPWPWYEALRNNDHSHLSSASFHKGGLQGLTRARCMVWNPGHELYEEEFVLMHSQDYQR